MAIFQVIKFDGPQEALVWKHPKENITSGSQLVVGPAQTAVFVREGQICDLFESGTYTLDTYNLPILSALVNLPFGGRSPFAAEVFYVNQRSILDIKWGTQVPIQLKDPVYQVIIPLRAFGQYGVSVQDPALFMEKLVGTAHAYTTDDLVRYFRGLVGSRVTDGLSTALTEEGISFVEASARIAELSERIAQRLQDFFAAYGIRLVNFFINSINAPENDPTVQRLKAVLSERQKMDALNYNYQQAQTYNILGRAADQLGGRWRYGRHGRGSGHGGGGGRPGTAEPPIRPTGSAHRPRRQGGGPRLLRPLRHSSARRGGLLPQVRPGGQRAAEPALQLLRLPLPVGGPLLCPLWPALGSIFRDLRRKGQLSSWNKSCNAEKSAPDRKPFRSGALAYFHASPAQTGRMGKGCTVGN